MPNLGIIAGNGSFPLMAAQEARSKGMDVFAVAVRNEADPELESLVQKLTWVRLGEMEKLVRFFQENKVDRLFFAGKITKTSLWKGDIRPDWEAVKMLAPAKDRKDDTLLGAVCSYLEKKGFRILECTALMDSYMAKPGVLTRRQPSRAQQEDIQFGWELAKRVAGFDIGQAVVVKDKAVMAVEAIEGTDEAIRRGGALGGRGVTVVKVAKPRQDMRFDVPTVGLQTLQAMTEVKASVLAVEAGRTLVLDREAFIRKADQKGLVIVGK